MKRVVCLALVLWSASARGQATTRRPLYVSPSGSDTEGLGTALRPWYSMERARAFIATKGWTSSMTANQEVHFAGSGTIWNQASTLGPSDGGTNGFYVIYENDGGAGTVTLAGGQQLAGSCWQVYSGSISRCPLQNRIYALYENGVPATEARSPAAAPTVHYPTALGPYYSSAGLEGSHTVIQYNPVDFDPSTWPIADTRIVDWSNIFGFTNWMTDTHTVTALNTTTHQFTLNSAENGGLKFDAMLSGLSSRYFVQGPVALITGAGQFAWSGGWLYYWPRATPIASQTIVAPTTKDVIRMVGTDASTRVSHVKFSGLTVAYSDFDAWYQYGNGLAADYSYWRGLTQAAHALVYGEHTDNIALTQMHLQNAGFAGLQLRGAALFDSFSQGWIDHVGTTGILVDGPSPGTGDTSNNDTFSDFIISDFGLRVGDGMGVLSNQNGTSLFEKFEIFRGPRNGLRLTGCTNDMTDCTPTSAMYSGHNIVRYGRVHDTNQDSGDVGAIGNSFKSRVSTDSFTQILVNGIYSDPSMTDLVPNGAFFDNQSDGTTISNVLSSNTLGAPFRENDSTGNTVSNCSFLEAGTANGSFDESQIQYANIGPTTANPYRSTALYSFFDGFENGSTNWTASTGSVTVSTSQAHDGTHSLSTTTNGQVVYASLGAHAYGLATVWFYDPGTTNLDALARADEAVYSSGTWQSPATDQTTFRALGVTQSKSTTNYVCWRDATTTVVSTIARSVGWHRFDFDYRVEQTGTAGDVKMSIDGTQVCTGRNSAVAAASGVRAVSQVAVGDFYGRTFAGGFWDGVQVSN